MGFRVQLITVSGKEPGTLWRDYGVLPTGELEEIPESPVVGAALPNGAYLLYINDPDRIVLDDEIFARLSKGASLIACYVNETVMNSYACEWANGVEQWSVFHDAQQEIEHLETNGILPPEFRVIRDRLFAQQQGDDGSTDFIFDIPVELFEAFGGISYNRDIPGAEPDLWEVLEAQ